MVGRVGIEPTKDISPSDLQSDSVDHLDTDPDRAADGLRPHDILFTGQTLFRLSYSGEYSKTTPTGHDPAVSALTMLRVGQLHHRARAAGVPDKHACCEFFSFCFVCQVSHSPGIRLLRFQQRGRRCCRLLPAHCALEKEKREGVYPSRLSSRWRLVQVFSSISLQAHMYSSRAGPQYQTVCW
jgi:hypothetical protein